MSLSVCKCVSNNIHPPMYTNVEYKEKRSYRRKMDEPERNLTINDN